MTKNLPRPARFACSMNSENEQEIQAYVAISLNDSSVHLFRITSAPNEERLIWNSIFVIQTNAFVPYQVMFSELVDNEISLIVANFRDDLEKHSIDQYICTCNGIQPNEAPYSNAIIKPNVRFLRQVDMYTCRISCWTLVESGNQKKMLLMSDASSNEIHIIKF